MFRRLLVEGFQLNLCNADLNLLSPDGLRHLVEDPAWITRGGAIFFLVASVFQFTLMFIAARLDSKRDPVLLKIHRIRDISSKEFYEDEGNDAMESLPAYEDFKKLHAKGGLRSSLNHLAMGKMGEMKEMDMTDKSWQWLVRLFARHAMRYAFKWKMASLEPDAFKYITQDEFRADAQAAITEFVLLPHEWHVLVFLLSSSRLTSSFLADYKLSRFERITSFSVVLLSSIAWIVVVFHWLGYLGGHTAGSEVHSECSNAGRGSTVQFFEEVLVSFAIYFLNEFVFIVLVRIRGGRFLLSKAAAFDEWSWSPICRLGLYVIFIFLLYLLSLFVMLHFLATATVDDVDHCLLVMAMIFGFAVVLKPLLISSSLMGTWLAATKWKAGVVTEQMVSMVYVADKRPNTLSAKEIEKLDEDFAKKLLGLQDSGPVFYEEHHDPAEENLQVAIDDQTLADDTAHLGSEGGEARAKDSMIDLLITAEIQEAVRHQQIAIRTEEPSYGTEAPINVEADIDAFDSESWEALNTEDGSATHGQSV